MVMTVRILTMITFFFTVMAVTLAVVHGDPQMVIVAALPLVVVAYYFMPTAIAFKRKHNQQEAIAVLNLLLGWTFIGWVIALVWACTSDVAPAWER